MRYSIDLYCKSSQEWLDAVMDDFESFLQDHADCERKASAMAMSLIAKYPNRKEIIKPLIALAIEELEHFGQVIELMQKRGFSLASDMQKDPYVTDLIKITHGGTPETRFLDRLLLGSIIEVRGWERFKMISEALEDEQLKKFYKALWVSEAKHGNLFVDLALNYFEEDKVYKRLHELIAEEEKILKKLTIRATLH